VISSTNVEDSDWIRIREEEKKSYTRVDIGIGEQNVRWKQFFNEFIVAQNTCHEIKNRWFAFWIIICYERQTFCHTR
jgi:hypothetical protein